jgi:transcriptional regulator with XRE-family HTH domain
MTNPFITAGAIDMSSFGARLAQVRRDIDLTQEGFARAVGLTRSSIAQYEGGRATPPLDTIFKLAEALGADPRFLIFGDQPGRGYEAMSGGRLVQVGGQDNIDEGRQAVIGLPLPLVAEFGARELDLLFLSLEVEAPWFKAKAGSLLLLAMGFDRIKPDGGLYAVRSTAGLALVRSEPLLGEAEPNRLRLTDGQGLVCEAISSTLAPVGRLIALLQKADGPPISYLVENAKVDVNPLPRRARGAG